MEPESATNSVATIDETRNENSRLGLCEVCTFREGKYKCPRCDVKTCSFRCCKIHKMEIECDGQINQTKFIPLNKFTDVDLSTDYRLLEEICKNIEIARKKFGKRIGDDVPYHLIRLRNAAKLQNINLKFLPYEFAKHKNNSSHVNFITKMIYWDIDWIFVNAHNLKLTDKKIAGIKKVSSILHKHLENEKLQYYRASDLSGIRVFLKAEQQPGKKFYEIDPSMTLEECLQRKLIIEYPTFYVVLKDEASNYSIIDSDDEEETMDTHCTKTGDEIVERIIRNAESTESLYNSLKNLLFISEYSDKENKGD